MRKSFIKQVIATVATVGVMLSTVPSPAQAQVPRLTRQEIAWCRFWADYLTFPWWSDYAYSNCIYEASQN